MVILKYMFTHRSRLDIDVDVDGVAPSFGAEDGRAREVARRGVAIFLEPLKDGDGGFGSGFVQPLNEHWSTILREEPAIRVVLPREVRL